MNELRELPLSQTDEIIIRIHMIDGETFIQPLPFDHLDGVESFMKWYRNPKLGPVWTWQVPSAQKLNMLPRSHIIGVDIDGYIEPDGRESKWYEKVIDKARSRFMMMGRR